MRYEDVQRSPALHPVPAGGESASGFVSILEATARSFGYSAGTLLFMPSRTDRGLSDLVIESSLPMDFFHEYDSICPPLPNCTLFSLTRATILPVQWSLEDMSRQFRLVREGDLPVIPLYRRYGIKAGILYPLAAIDGSRHILRYDGDRTALAQAEVNDLAMASMRLLEAYDRARSPLGNDPCGLTERECDVIRWSATGRTSSEIARVLGLSDHTVNAYLNAAMRKMNCANRTQLVAKAMRMRIIS